LPVPDERAKGDIGRSYLIEDAARLMGVSRRTVYYRIRAGHLRTIRTRCGSQRVLLSSIEALTGMGAADEAGNAGEPPRCGSPDECET
jgi:excisionase family DNA binding protein